MNDSAHQDATAAQLLADHRWTRKGCACGWSQHAVLPRRARAINHPHHQAGVLRDAGLLVGENTDD